MKEYFNNYIDFEPILKELHLHFVSKHLACNTTISPPKRIKYYQDNYSANISAKTGICVFVRNYIPLKRFHTLTDHSI